MVEEQAGLPIVSWFNGWNPAPRCATRAVRRHTGGGMGGLGLAIAQRIAILHGGRLQATTSAGGTQMCLHVVAPVNRESLRRDSRIAAS